MDLLPPIVFELRAKAGEVHAELAKVGTEVSKMEKETSGSTSKMQHAFNTAAGAGKAITFGVAAAGVAVAGFSIEAAASAQVVDAKLGVAVKNAGGNMQKMAPQVEELDSKLRTYGFTNEQTNTALATLTTSLKDPAKAMSVMGVASDLARQKGIDLNAAALMVAKGMEGQTRPLKALGIDLPVYAGNAQAVKLAQLALGNAQDKVNAILAKTPDAANASSKAHGAYEKAMQTAAAAQEKLTQTQSSGDQILRTLTDRVKGGAAAYGGTFAGSMAAAKAAIQDIGEKIGKVLIPIIMQVIKTGQQWANFLMAHKPILIAIGVIISTVLVVALYAWAAAAWAAAAANTALTWPIVLIIAAIVALVAAIVWVVSNWSSVVAAFAHGWQQIAGFFVAIGGSIASWWNGFWNGIFNFAKALFSAYIGVYVAIFKFLYTSAVAVGSAIVGWWNGLWNGIFNWAKAVFTAAINFYVTVFKFLYTTFVNIGATLIGWWNTTWNWLVNFARGIFQGFISWVQGVWTGFVNLFNSIGHGLTDAWNGLWNGMANIVRTAFGGIATFVKGVINGIIDMVNGAIGAINGATGGLKGIGINVSIPKIPHFADGGIMPHNGLALVGERGPEVVRLPAGAQVYPNGTGSGSTSSTNGGAGTKQYIVNATTNADPAQIMAEMGWLSRMAG